ncbi:hypothetical protein BASA81_003979 [Batrachochytrium salamandrivorans]|nr:hypothetical protein BASA81_003979 [Batrachochytrium salamandrivorans]
MTTSSTQVLLGARQEVIDVIAASSSNTRLKLPSAIYTKLGTCMPPSADTGSVLAVSKYICAYGTKGGSLRVMLTREGTATAKLNGHATSVVDTAITSDGKPGGYSTLASLSGDGMLRLWEIPNQESGGELDTREILCLKTKIGQAQRVCFHPEYQTSPTPTVFVCAGNKVFGVVLSKELRDDMAASSQAWLSLERVAKIKLESKRLGKVLDLQFDGAARVVTGHDSGQTVVWSLSSSKQQPPYPLVLECGKSPVLTVGFLSSNLVVVGNDRNLKVAVWDLTTRTVVQQVGIVRTNGSKELRSFRTCLVKRLADHTACLVMFESRSPDVVLVHLSCHEQPLVMTRAVLAVVDHTVLCCTGEYDMDRDLVVCHIVDVDCIGDLAIQGHAAFGSTVVGSGNERPPRESLALLRRLSRRTSKQSLVPASDFSSKPQCFCFPWCFSLTPSAPPPPAVVAKGGNI